MKTGWHYRIVQKDGKYGIHPVFVDEYGDIVNINDMPEVCENNLFELQTKVEKAWDYPVLNFETGE